MSIVLPSEISDAPKRGKSGRKPSRNPLLAGLKGLQVWQFLFREPAERSRPEYIQPAGKIRLVTSRWDDRGSKHARKSPRR